MKVWGAVFPAEGAEIAKARNPGRRRARLSFWRLLGRGAGAVHVGVGQDPHGEQGGTWHPFWEAALTYFS